MACRAGKTDRDKSVLKLIRSIVAANIFTGLAVWLLSYFIDAFSITGVGDFLFYMLVLIWSLALLGMGGGTHSHTLHGSRAGSKTKSMVSDHDFDADHNHLNLQNFGFGFMMFLAGLPAFAGCIYMMWTL